MENWIPSQLGKGPGTFKGARLAAPGADSSRAACSGKVSDGPSCGVILLNSPRTGR